MSNVRRPLAVKARAGTDFLKSEATFLSDNKRHEERAERGRRDKSVSEKERKEKIVREEVEELCGRKIKRTSSVKDVVNRGNYRDERVNVGEIVQILRRILLGRQRAEERWPTRKKNTRPRTESSGD